MRAVTSITLLFWAMAAGATDRFRLELEIGPNWQARNDVQIPNDANGTRFSLREIVGSGPTWSR